MSDAIADIQKRRGRPPVGSVPIMVKLPPRDVEALDLWIAENAPGETRPGAFRKLIRLVATRMPK